MLDEQGFLEKLSFSLYKHDKQSLSQKRKVSLGETGASPPCIFPTRLERAFCMLEDSTIHTCKAHTLATFHSIYMNLGLYMNAREEKIKIMPEGRTHPRPGRVCP